MIKDVKGFEGLYQITDNGEVYSLIRNKYLRPKYDKDGYKCLCLVKDGKNHHVRVHRLVAQTFIENPNNYTIVNHLDMNKLNNNVSNLEWTTVSGNTKHCYDNSPKFRESALKAARKGTLNHQKKCMIKGVFFNSRIEASKYFNVNEKTIYNWLKRGGDAIAIR